jgi:hypothetical protein
MFRNRWGALLFAALTLAGVAALVGSGQGEGAIKRATEQIAQQKAQADKLTTDTQAPAEPSSAPAQSVVMSADEELIDPAVGEDPTPIDEFAAANPAEPDADISDKVVIVSRDTAGQPAQGQAQPQTATAPPQQQ